VLRLRVERLDSIEHESAQICRRFIPMEVAGGEVEQVRTWPAGNRAEGGGVWANRL
jgi:hypothetical protein